MSGPLLTAGEVAELLAVPESWVREATRSGRIPHVCLGRYRRYEREAIEAWLVEQRGGHARAHGTTGQAARNELGMRP
jgi:excisionase family DNA binding protein